MEEDPLEEVINQLLVLQIETNTIHENDERMKMNLQKITFSKSLLETS
jgi:tRNA(Met) C34 N-acetyltransferase TmcA